MCDDSVLNILFYVDDDAFSKEDKDKYTTKLLTQALSSGVVPTKVRVERRDKKVPLASLLDGYHEIWFFLRSVVGGTAALNAAEIAALKAWMDAGKGVLITGDHASGDPLQGLGASVGKCVPRARHMRFWDDPPDLSTIVADTTGSLPRSSSGLDVEKNEVPQRLLLPWTTMRRPYSVFHGVGGRIIEWFPDHAHEGQVKDTISRPDPPDPDFPDIANEWPFSPPGIKIIARSVDWKHGRTFDLMAQWDGAMDCPPGQSYGRIIADSSWHHYVDANLGGLVPTKDWAKIQELYRNQAAWLAPKSFRRGFLDCALRRVRQGPEIQVLLNTTYRAIGEFAMPLLARMLPGVWAHDLIDDIYDANGVSPNDRLRGEDVDLVVLGSHIKHMLMPDEAMRLMGTPVGQGAGHGLRMAIDGYAREQEERLAQIARLQSILRPSPEPEDD